MAELGSTADPAALVPGDPVTLRASASDLGAHARVLGQASAGLGRITTPEGWSGSAADRFREAYDLQPPRWQEATDAFTSAARIVDGHAEAMEWARVRAAEAVARWQQGESATAGARAESDRTAGDGTPVPFVDGGEPARAEAQRMLAEARARLRESGDRSAPAVMAACRPAPEGPGFWEDLADGAGAVAAQIGNGAASLGNAMLNNPLDTIAIVGGGALATVSAAGVVGSVALDATGVGLVGGVPLGAASIAGVATGVGIAGAGAVGLAAHALGDDRVAPFTVNSDADAGDETPPLQPADRIPTIGEPGSNEGVRTLPTEQDIEDLYDDLASNGTPVSWNAYPGSAVLLPDGTEIGLRGQSQSGGTTIDARLPNGDRWKIHLPRR